MSTLRLPTAVALSTAVCWLVAGTASSSAATTASCGTSGYAYAGVGGNSRAYGLAARLTTLSAPDVRSGHVAAWVGFGGPGQGPNGSDEWIQVGYSGFPGSSTSSLYYEVARPSQAPVYQEVQSGLAPGTTRKLAVVELAQRHGWWRVWVDDHAVSDPIFLPGSHGTWRPIATSETWGAGTFVCNHFRYRFAALSVATRAGGAWSPLARVYTFQGHGCRIRRSLSGYVASNG